MLEQFIFHEALKTKLQHILNNPNSAGGVLCFYGSCGIGKTSLAKEFGRQLANQTIHYDCTNKAQSWVLRDIQERAMTTSLDALYQSHKAFDNLFVLDEFDSLTKANKNALKIPLEELTSSGRHLFIICVNSTQKGLSVALSPAIKSRCLSINFDPPKNQYAELARIIKLKYPGLTNEFILANLPDLRQIIKHSNWC